MAIFGQQIFSGYVMYFIFFLFLGGDLGPVRAGGAIPPGKPGPSRSRSHGRLRRSKSPRQSYSPSASFSRFFVEAIMLLIAFFVTICVSVLKPAEPCR